MTTSLQFLQTRNKDASIIKKIHDALIACGMVATADTGQLDQTSAASYNGTSANNYGYNVYKFGDTAQATTPIFFRIDWLGSAVTNYTNWNFKITVGTGSNGSGTINGTADTVRFLGFGSATVNTVSTTAFSVLVTGDGSGIALAFAFDDNTGSVPAFFVIDRFRDTTGAAKTTGFWYYVPNQAAAVIKVWSTSFSGTTGTLTGIPFLHPWPWTAVSEGNAGAYPIFPVQWLSPAIENSLMVVGLPTIDNGLAETFQAAHLGATHTFWVAIPGATGGTITAGYGQAVNTGGIALLFE